MELDPNIVAKLPTDDLQALLQIASRLAPLGVAIELKRSLSQVRASAGQASARARMAKFGTPNPRANRIEPVNKTGTNEREQREQNVNTPPVNNGNKREQNVNKKEGGRGEVSPPPLSLSLSSEISDLRSEDQRESARAREACAPKQPKPTKEPKAVRAPTWRRVPDGWQPNDQHRQIATDCCVPFDLELAKFRDHEFSTPKRDPDATFRNWLRNARPAKSSPFPALPAQAPRPKHATMADIDRMMGLA